MNDNKLCMYYTKFKRTVRYSNGHESSHHGCISWLCTPSSPVGWRPEPLAASGAQIGYHMRAYRGLGSAISAPITATSASSLVLLVPPARRVTDVGGHDATGFDSSNAALPLARSRSCLFAVCDNPVHLDHRPPAGGDLVGADKNRRPVLQLMQENPDPNQTLYPHCHRRIVVQRLVSPVATDIITRDYSSSVFVGPVICKPGAL